MNEINRVERIARYVLVGCVLLSTIALVVALFSPRKGSPSGQRQKTAAAEGQSNPGSRGNAAAMAPSGNAGVVTVEAITLEPKTIKQTIRINGDVVSRSRIVLYADTSGKLVSYQVGVGANVAKGDVVAFVDPSRPGAAYATSPVRSTISGTVISLPYNVGDTVSPSSPVASVGKLDDLEIVSHVPEKYSGVLRKGLSAEASLVAWPNERFSAEVTSVSPVVDSESRTVEIRLRVGAGLDRFKHGMFAVVTLVTRESRAAMVVPRSAVRTYNRESVVYVVTEAGLARRVPVTLGLANDVETELTGGVSFGDSVIASGSLSEGTPVRVARAEGSL